MTIKQIEDLFHSLPINYKTKDVDRLNKRLIKEKQDVSCLKDLALGSYFYHRTYFQVSLGQILTYEDQYKFIEENYLLLNDWWHVDQLPQFIKKVPLEYAFKKALIYINDPHPFLRRWGYVQFIPTLVKEKEAFDLIIKLFKDDDHYYVQMAEAWLISYLAIYHGERVLDYLNEQTLNYNIIGKAIQKSLDSFRIDNTLKEKIKQIRKRYK